MNQSLIRAVVITVSDACARGEREDVSGEALARLLREAGAEVVAREVMSTLEPLAPACGPTPTARRESRRDTGGTGLARATHAGARAPPREGGSGTPRRCAPGALARTADLPCSSRACAGALRGPRRQMPGLRWRARVFEVIPPSSPTPSPYSPGATTAPTVNPLLKEASFPLCGRSRVAILSPRVSAHSRVRASMRDAPEGGGGASSRGAE